jgi:hypothetical protein
MKTTRRDIMMLAGGSAVGVLFTPAPWRLITDTALWSENWPGIPRPARGEIRVRYSNCPLCPAGCAVRARCVGDQPVSLAGVPGHPLSHGALCAFGLAGHHLPYHPARLQQGPVKEAAAAVAGGMAKLGASEHVVTLDLRPARTASWTYRRAMAAVKNGRYVAASSGPGEGIAVDLAKARTVLSLGVPVLDGWGTPGNVIAARPGFRLIQAEAVESRTASMADLWVRIRPGSEDALAQGLAGAISPAAAAEATGVSEARIVTVSKEMAENGPVLVLGAARLEGAGRTVVGRRETPVPAEWQKAAAPVTDLAELPDGSVRVLMIDESAPDGYLPWDRISRKLVADNPVVVAFASTRQGYGRYAQYVLPVGVYPEVADDIPPAVDSVAAAFRIAAPLVPAPAGMVKPEEFVANAAGLAIGDPLGERADAIHKAGRGSLFTYTDAKTVALKDVTAEDFRKALWAGACWTDTVDEKAPLAPPAAAVVQSRPEEDAELPLAMALSHELTPASPLLSKLYRESNLRLGPGRVALHPSCGLDDGVRATLQTARGRCAVEVTLDAGVPPGVVQATAWPALLDLCAPGARAKVVRV